MNITETDLAVASALYPVLVDCARQEPARKLTYGALLEEAKARFPSNHAIQMAIPVSLGPTVLERAYEKSDRIYPRESKYRGTKDATGLFYLLREFGPSLVGSTKDTGTSDVAEDNGEY